MTRTPILLLFALSLSAGAAGARDLAQVNPPFPRIANCYATGLAGRNWEQGRAYWSKVDLIIGGCYDLHYDWEHPRWAKALEHVEANIRRIREVNPHVLVLPYVDVVEGPDSPNVPKHWWALNDKGERWSGWPGMLRIRTDLPEVLQFNLDRVREEVLGRECFDGVFYDCWAPDDFLVPRTAALRDGKAVVMLNAWNLPATGFRHLNGALAEDEINRIVDGKVEFEEFLGRYLRWTRESRTPVVTTLVCNPQGISNDPWVIHRTKRTPEQRRADEERERTFDLQTMRFGLATTLMGDGYFAFDGPTTGRGNWWWYPEYDAPLGYPKGPARRQADGTWQRDYDGGTVVVNGTPYDTVVTLKRKCRDVSSGRVGTRFTLPMFDGRIFLPTEEPATTTADAAPRLTAGRPDSLRVAALREGTAVQTPGGLDLRFSAGGALQAIRWRGRQVMTGGWPVVAAPPFAHFRLENASGGPADPPVQPGAGGKEARLSYRGTLVEGEQRVDMVQTCTVHEDDRFTLRFECTAATDLNLRLWRHYFAFPVASYAGATATAGGKSVVLPQKLGDDQILPASEKSRVEAKDVAVTIESSLPLGLSDHRKWGPAEYLLAGYPKNGAVSRGTKWAVEIRVAVAKR